jgi:hypothetical protein
LREVFVVWIFEMSWNGALSVPMRKETELDGKGCVTGGDKDRSFVGKPSRSEVGSSLEVSQKSNGFDKVTLSWLSVVGAGHDDGKLDLEAEL